MRSRASSMNSPSDSPISSAGTLSQSSSPWSATHSAPRFPYLAPRRAPSSPITPAHLAPLPAAFMIGTSGRLPLGPVRSSSVAPAPIATPMSVAVSRSYCCSRSSSREIARADSRAWPPVLGRGRTVVAIFSLVIEQVVVEARGAARDQRRLGLVAERRHSRTHSTYCCRGRDEGILRLFLHHLHERVELAQPFLRDVRGLLQPLLRRRDRLVHALHVHTDGRRDVIEVVRHRARVLHERVHVGVDLVQKLVALGVALPGVVGGR